MRHRLRAFLRLKSGASWKKGHLLQSVLIVVLLSGHHPFEHWQCDCYHDYAEHYEYDEFIADLRYTCAEHHYFS
jgi:hypothetical protein